MKSKGFQELFEFELKDLYSAEKQLVKALPKMAKAVTNEELRQAIENHLEDTLTQVGRLESIFSQLDVSYGRVEKCKAMEGLLSEAEKTMKEELDPPLLDAALICAAQRVEHYEIAGYGCARTFAQQLGYTEFVDMLQETLNEETDADKKLTEIAMNTVNAEAVGANTTTAQESTKP